jgi:hypothetical protein
MADISGIPYLELEFTKDGEVFRPKQLKAVTDFLKAGPVTDLIVAAHGWNNNMEEARALYQELFGNIAALIPSKGAAVNNRKFAILGVLWPSKKFDDPTLLPGGGEDGGGAASLGGAVADDAALIRQIDGLKDLFDKPEHAKLDKMKQLVDRLADSPKARREFVDLVRQLLPQSQDTTDDPAGRFADVDGDLVFKRLSMPVKAPRGAPSAAGVASVGSSRPRGQAAGLGEALKGMKAAASRILNKATYYMMKERAGAVGIGLNQALHATLGKAQKKPRLHLVGHSFGARVITAAADGAHALSPASLTLLQGAFSHNGFAVGFDESKQTNGFFFRVVSENKVKGPIVVTHTVNDRAVGIAYAIASRVSGDNRLAIGDEKDMYGGIGRNGALKLPANAFNNAKLLAENGSYDFSTARVYNLAADAFINDHGDVRNKAVANAVLQAIAV